VTEPLFEVPLGPVAVPESVDEVPLLVAVPEAVLVPPLGPVTVPATVVVLPLVLVVPEAVVVPPLGPVTVAESLVPVRVRVEVAVPENVFPLALVAVPVAVTDVPFSVTEVDAVPPRLVVTVFCAWAAVERQSIPENPATAIVLKIIFVISFSLRSELLDHSDTGHTQLMRCGDTS
jgi:hypothetical protein